MTFTGETLGLSETKNLFLGETKHLVKLHILPPTSKWVKNVDQLIKKYGQYDTIPVWKWNVRIQESRSHIILQYTHTKQPMHWANIGGTSRVCWTSTHTAHRNGVNIFVTPVKYREPRGHSTYYQSLHYVLFGYLHVAANMTRCHYVVLMLAQRRRRCVYWGNP